MNLEVKIMKPKLGLLELSRQRGSVTLACKVFGYSWTIFLFSRKILSTSNWRIFRVSKGGANSASRKILREKLELHSASKKSLNIAKMLEKRFELPTSTHDLSYEKIRLADCHKIPIFF